MALPGLLVLVKDARMRQSMFIGYWIVADLCRPVSCCLLTSADRGYVQHRSSPLQLRVYVLSPSIGY
jgi:hypothetical protein